MASRREEIISLTKSGQTVSRRVGHAPNNPAFQTTINNSPNTLNPATAQTSVDILHGNEDVSLRQIESGTNLLRYALMQLKTEIGDSAYDNMDLGEKANAALFLVKAAAQARLEAEQVITQSATHDAMQSILAVVPRELTTRHLLGRRLVRNSRLDQVVEQVAGMVIATAADNNPGLVGGMKSWAEAAQIRAEGSESAARSMIATQNMQNQVQEDARRNRMDGTRKNVVGFVDDALGTIVDKDRGIGVRAVDSLTNAGAKVVDNLSIPALGGAGIGGGAVVFAAAVVGYMMEVDISGLPEELRTGIFIGIGLMAIGAAAMGGRVGKSIENSFKQQNPSHGQSHSPHP